jgi:hypothetical protein
MDQDDPEQRIAELQRRLAEQERIAELERHQAEPVGQPPQMLDARAATPGEPIRRPLSERILLRVARKQYGGNAVSEMRRDLDRRSIGNWFAIIIAAGFALLGFVWGAHDFYQYRVGTPTTATVTYCTVGAGAVAARARGASAECRRPGRSKRGLTFSAPSVGSSLNVRVSGGTAYTADESVPGFGLGVLLVGPIVAFVSWPGRSRRIRASRLAGRRG